VIATHPRRGVKVDVGADRCWVWLSSDQHIGSRYTDYRLLQREIRKAADLGAYVVLNGDLFDMILPGDRKRFDLEALHPRIAGSCDVVGKAVEWACELFEPVRSKIVSVGFGNHELSVLRHCSIDVAKMFCERLGLETEPCVREYVLINLRASPKRSRPFKILRHHGGGGAAPVTQGIIDVYREKGVAVDADLITMGHKHTTLDLPMVRERCCDAGVVTYEPVRLIRTGSYFCPSLGDSYAVHKGMAPLAKGGAFVEVYSQRYRDGGCDHTVVGVGAVEYGA